MMRMMVQLLLVAALVSGCGNKGHLKSPTQIQNQEAKKARAAAAKEAGEQPAPEDLAPEPVQAPKDMKVPVLTAPSNDVAK